MGRFYFSEVLSQALSTHVRTHKPSSPFLLLTAVLYFMLWVHRRLNCLSLGVRVLLESLSSREVVLCEHVLCAHVQMFLLDSCLEVELLAPSERYSWF